MKIIKQPTITGIGAPAAGVFLVLFLLLAPPHLATGQQATPDQHFITIGSGQVNGIYFPLSRALCRILNQPGRKPLLLASVERTRGSLYNLRALGAGIFEFGLAQSDHLAAAREKKGEFKQRIKNLRTVFSLYEEIFTIVVRADSPIHQIADLKHRRISIGRPGSGGYATVLALLKGSDWQNEDIKQVNTLRYDRALDELCRSRVDTVIFTAGHPFQPLLDAERICHLRLLPVSGKVIDLLLHRAPGYNYTTIPGGLYPGTPKPVPSFGVTATLVSSTRVDADLVYEVVKRVMENLDVLRKVHPALRHLTRKRMVSGCLAAPFHPGALRYYREAGLLRELPANPDCRPRTTP